MGSALRFGAAAALCAICFAAAQPVLAQGLPPALLGQIPTTTSGKAAIEADTLTFDAATGVIMASGNVELKYSGFTGSADQIVYNSATGEVRMSGNVVIVDPTGTTYATDSFEMTGGLKQAFLRSLTIRTAKGGMITAESADFANEIRTTLTNAVYSPCGDCIDEQGRTIGWRIRANVFVYDNEAGTITMEQPSLELLGVPVAWLPSLTLPDPTRRQNGFQFPSIDYGEKIGVKLVVPYFWAVAKDTDIIFTPTLLSRQGLLLGAEWVQRYRIGTMTGETSVKASGIYQFDKDAFAKTVGEREWRGAIQTTGKFVPLENWTVGWSYTAFTDPGYLRDYRMTESEDYISQAYATYLDTDTWFDARVQRFNRLGNIRPETQAQQGSTLPRAVFEDVFTLGDGRGRLELSGRLLGIVREADQNPSYNGVPYVFGYAGNKAHLMLQAAWQNQWIVPGGLVATPYLGLRGDAAYYDGTSALNPGQVSLLTATPIAAVDVRWPLMGFDGANTHLVEPIAQLVYRGSDTSLVGITNDDAQSFVFDDTLLFSYNRFSGGDRQETGLRLNLGGRYHLELADGGYFDLIAGQSFHLAGVNAFTIDDQVNNGVANGLGMTASYFVGGFDTVLFESIRAGAKIQVDTGSWQVMRAAAQATYETDRGYAFDFGYYYLPANTALGLVREHHEIGATATIPLMDYWRIRAGLTWDIDENTWVEARAGIGYDDGYLAYGLNYTLKPNDQRFTLNFALKGPDGINFSF